jgi:hypothetical protein
MILLLMAITLGVMGANRLNGDCYLWSNSACRSQCWTLDEVPCVPSGGGLTCQRETCGFQWGQCLQAPKAFSNPQMSLKSRIDSNTR